MNLEENAKVSVEVHLQNVVKLFGDVSAVDDVTLEIKKGELFFLLGPSGCGKTTCLRIIAGFYRPDLGKLYFDDRLINDVPPHKRNTGMVFQNYALWPHMTVYENVEYGLNVRKLPKDVKKEKVNRALEIVQMTKYADRTANQLSGGQQQRIALARALVIEPDVLLLDEPLSNLDAKLRLEMRQEIKRIHSESSITAVYVTHDQKEALSLADRLAVMNNGKIVQVGAPREVYNFPASRFVADFIGETNFIKGTLRAKSNQSASVESVIGNIQSIYSPFEGGVGGGYHQISEGDALICSIRPESINILNSPVIDKENQFQGKVLNLTYLGNVEEYQLLIEEKMEAKAVLHNPSSVERHPGEEVIVHFEPKDVVLLPVNETTQGQDGKMARGQDGTTAR
jgi:iron(III) transport system ATP-binding protein